MNTGRDWDKFAKGKDYRNLRHMLQELYVKKDIRGRELAKLLDCSHIRTLQLLEKCGIKRKPQGGAFIRAGQYKLADVPDKEIRELTSAELSKKHKVHITTARRMKRVLRQRDIDAEKGKGKKRRGTQRTAVA